MPANTPIPAPLNLAEGSQIAVVGAILAMAVIRLLEHQNLVDNLTKQSVSTGCPDHQGEPQ